MLRFHCLSYSLDHSRQISRAELEKVLHALNIKPNADELKQLMATMDSDNSGEIDFNEFKKVMAGSFFKKYSKKELEAAFRKFDTDGSQYITAQELQHILTRMGRSLNRSDIEAMIKQVDSSGDGKISFEEFCHLFD
jgi:Ca2+-binding EF-hand superfamily protein